MSNRDPQKAKERKRRYLERQKVAKYGPAAAGIDMRGRHGNHARRNRNGRWNDDEKMISSHGYVLVRVGIDHPLAVGNGYAYEHLLVWSAAGRPLPAINQVLHHRDGNKKNNRLQNLELTTRSDHAINHIVERDRDVHGRLL